MRSEIFFVFKKVLITRTLDFFVNIDPTLQAQLLNFERDTARNNWLLYFLFAVIGGTRKKSRFAYFG